MEILENSQTSRIANIAFTNAYGAEEGTVIVTLDAFTPLYLYGPTK